MMIRFLLLGVIFGLTISAPDSWAAYGDRPRGADEARHVLSLAGGVSSPGVATSLGENPAGLAYNQSAKFQFSLGVPNSAFNPLGFGGHFLIGNGWVGAGVGLRTYNQFTAGASNLMLLDFGLGAMVESLNLAIGFSGGFTLFSTGPVWGSYAGASWGGDLGIILFPNERFRVGVAAYQVLAGVRALGLGFAFELSPWADFVLDSSWNPYESTVAIVPALGVHLWNFQMQLAYGFRLIGTDWTWLRQGFSAGLGFELSYNLLFQFYYNHLSLYSAGLTLRL